MTSHPAKHLSPSLQFLILVAITIGVLLVGNLIGAGLVMAFYGLDMVLNIAQLNLAAPGTANALWILQILGTTLPLLFVPLVFARFVVKQPQEYLKPSSNIPWTLFAIVFCVMMISSPLIELLSRINQHMVFPEYLSGVQKWMRDSEDKAEKLITLLLKMDTVFGAIANVIAVGLFTAIVEELMFRGCVQTIFVKWTGNVHAAVWITGILFSAFHMEFFGFLPRLFLGVLFGYFTAWSGSIWPAIWAHFINNGSAVIAVYLYQHKLVKIDPNSTQIFKYPAYVFSFIIVLFLLFLYNNVAKKPKTAP
ncbi:CPBP family intramembrane glutamic endopeptidase [Mucilaginibacter calamicampi]|uniref:CPBP family intramembrane glutamic endopeptidase n=1 Tax=Mucilaginibacter calamicampi TaxID=1302352 RepID=A0ABW2Z023_9SPHI